MIIGNLSFESILIAISGIVTVFLMLILLSVLVVLLSKGVTYFSGKGKKGENGVSSDAAPVAPKQNNSVQLIDVDEKTAACVIAVVSFETGIALEELHFNSIRAL